MPAVQRRRQGSLAEGYLGSAVRLCWYVSCYQHTLHLVSCPLQTELTTPRLLMPKSYISIVIILYCFSFFLVIKKQQPGCSFRSFIQFPSKIQIRFKSNSSFLHRQTLKHPERGKSTRLHGCVGRVGLIMVKHNCLNMTRQVIVILYVLTTLLVIYEL